MIVAISLTFAPLPKIPEAVIEIAFVPNPLRTTPLPFRLMMSPSAPEPEPASEIIRTKSVFDTALNVSLELALKVTTPELFEVPANDLLIITDESEIPPLPSVLRVLIPFF